MDISKYMDIISDYIDDADKKNWFLYAFGVLAVIVIYILFFQ